MNSILTVITPAENRKLTQRDTFKTLQGITSDTDNDLIDLLIDQNSAVAESYCDRVFATETVEELIYLGCSRTAIRLRRFPVTSITSIAEDGVALDPSFHEIDKATGRVYRLDSSGYRTCWSARKLVIRYVGGYVLPGDADRDLPPDIERAVLELVKGFYLWRKRDPALKREYSLGVAEYEYFQGDVSATGLPDGVTKLLDPYYRNIAY